ncbi:hypothetical protein ARMGADRAFT_546503 [Armillaria gallica]|uniref:Uncharacterized protein n=1 Tax=Armillaria gallica TaxID=47427 RepID=A0A2H3DC89_ARMGA|nr:hypothetical protein ARMGADRAFT_546503 [Armillaria gallica]
MAELQFQSEGSSLFDVPQYIPSYGVRNNQYIGHYSFGNSVGDFNLNAPVRHNPEVATTDERPSHSYLHNNPYAPPLLPACSTTSMNHHLYMESAGPPETHSEKAYFPQRPISHYDSEPLGGLTDFGVFDCNAWFSEKEVVGSSTFTPDPVGRTLVHYSTPPRDSSNLTSSRYHLYPGRKSNNECLNERSLFRTGFDASYSASSSRQSFEFTSNSSEPELPLLWRVFKPKISGFCVPEDHRPSEDSSMEQSEDPHPDARTLTVSPMCSDYLDEAVTQKCPRGFHLVSFTDFQTEHVVHAFGISTDSAICYERDVDTDSHICPLGCRRKFSGKSFRKHFSQFHPELDTKSGNFYCTVKSHPKVRCTGDAVHNTCFTQHFQLMHSLKEFLCPFCLSPQRHKQDVVRHFDMCEVLSAKEKYQYREEKSCRAL